MKFRKVARLTGLLVAAVVGRGWGAPQSAAEPPAGVVSSRVNSELPGWLRISGEERARFEYLAGVGFSTTDDRYLLNRLRLNLDLRPLRWLRFGFQAEDARVFGQNAQPAPASQKNSMDLRLGWVQAGTEESPVALRAGRQPLDFGDGRLLSDPNWSNVGRSFDAVRLTLRRGTAKLDLFSGTVVKADPVEFDEPAPASHFHGAYGSLGGIIPRAVIEPYLFWRLEHGYRNEAGGSGKLDEKTAGLRWAGVMAYGLDYAAEAAYQTGSWAGDRIGAWTLHWLVGHGKANVPRGRRFYLEYSRSTGDDDPHDGRRGTFDGLFASSHDKYGLSDLICSSNSAYLRTGVQFGLRRGVMAGASYNDFRLSDARDGLYAGGKLVARSTSGSAGAHVGQEADAQVQWQVSPATQMTAGYGYLFPGEFLKRTTAGIPYRILFWNLAQRF